MGKWHIGHDIILYEILHSRVTAEITSQMGDARAYAYYQGITGRFMFDNHLIKADIEENL